MPIKYKKTTPKSAYGKAPKKNVRKKKKVSRRGRRPAPPSGRTRSR